MRILFLDLDTLRPDHLGCYGYHRDTSPNIDRIASEGVRFTNVHCSDAPCLPSRAALFSGRFGIHTGLVGHGGTAADMRIQGSPRGFKDRVARESLPASLRAAGLRTVGVSSFAERHSAWWFYAGFNEMHNPGKSGLEPAEDVTPTALRWIDQHAKDDNWFLHVNYWDPHTPYRTPKEFGNPFADQPTPSWLTNEKIEAHRNQPGLRGARELTLYMKINPKSADDLAEVTSVEDMRRLFDGYDCGIRYTDDHIGILLDALASQGVLDETAIIITSDHGENLGELGLYLEHGTADQITTHIPLIVRWPGGKSGIVEEGLHYSLDLAPTLAELFGREPMSSWDGRGYARAITQGQQCGWEYLVTSECAHTCQRGVRFGPWMYLRTVHDYYHLWPKEMLFDIEQDPFEERDVACDNREACRQANYYLQQWVDAAMASMEYAADPLWTVMSEGGPYHARGLLPDYCRVLEETGRAWAVEELKRRHPQEFAQR